MVSVSFLILAIVLPIDGTVPFALDRDAEVASNPAFFLIECETTLVWTVKVVRVSDFILT